MNYQALFLELHISTELQLQLVMRGFSVNETKSNLEESVAPHSELKKYSKNQGQKYYSFSIF